MILILLLFYSSSHSSISAMRLIGLINCIFGNNLKLFGRKARKKRTRGSCLLFLWCLVTAIHSKARTLRTLDREPGGLDSRHKSATCLSWLGNFLQVIYPSLILSLFICKTWCWCRMTLKDLLALKNSKILKNNFNFSYQALHLSLPNLWSAFACF